MPVLTMLFISWSGTQRPVLCLQVTSVVAIVIGAWVLKERGQLVRDAASFYLDPSAMLCSVGAVAFLVAFVGCLGALRENICLLKTVSRFALYDIWPQNYARCTCVHRYMTFV